MHPVGYKVAMYVFPVYHQLRVYLSSKLTDIQKSYTAEIKARGWLHGSQPNIAYIVFYYIFYCHYGNFSHISEIIVNITPRITNMGTYIPK